VVFFQYSILKGVTLTNLYLIIRSSKSRARVRFYELCGEFEVARGRLEALGHDDPA